MGADIKLNPLDADDLIDERQFHNDNLGSQVVSDLYWKLKYQMTIITLLFGKKKNQENIKGFNSCMYKLKPAYIFVTLENSYKRISDILIAYFINLCPLDCLF